MDLNSPARIVAVVRRTQDFDATEVAASGLAVRTLVNTIGIAPRWMRVFSNGEVETAVHRTGSSRPAQWTSRPRLRVAPLEAITHLGFRVAGLQYGVIRLEWGAL